MRFIKSYSICRVSDPRSGFTLLEVIIATILISLAMVVGYGFWRFVMEQYMFSLGQSQSAYDVNRVLKQMTNDIREARDAENGAYLLADAGDDEIVFYADVDGDLLVERVRYFVEGSELRRGLVEPSGMPVGYDLGSELIRTVISNLHTPVEAIFYYYNESWPEDQVNNPLVAADRLIYTRHVGVRLTLSVEEDIGDRTYQMSQGVTLRNAKTN